MSSAMSYPDAIIGDVIKLPEMVMARTMWIEFVVGSLLALKVFLSGFSHSSDTNILNSN